jgi:hypothetical protein
VRVLLRRCPLCYDLETFDKMKVSTVFLLPCTVFSAVTLLPRQYNHGDMQPPKASEVPKLPGIFDRLFSAGVDFLVFLTKVVVPPAKFADSRQIPPKLRPDAMRTIARFGPYTLEAQVNAANGLVLLTPSLLT